MTTQLHATPIVNPARFTLNPLRWSQRTGALVSGTALTLMVFLSIFGYFIAVKGLTVPGDAAATAEAIAASPQLWIAGVAALYIVVVLDLLRRRRHQRALQAGEPGPVPGGRADASRLRRVVRGRAHPAGDRLQHPRRSDCRPARASSHSSRSGIPHSVCSACIC